MKPRVVGADQGTDRGSQGNASHILELDVPCELEMEREKRPLVDLEASNFLPSPVGGALATQPPRKKKRPALLPAADDGAGPAIPRSDSTDPVVGRLKVPEGEVRVALLEPNSAVDKMLGKHFDSGCNQNQHKRLVLRTGTGEPLVRKGPWLVGARLRSQREGSYFVNATVHSPVDKADRRRDTAQWIVMFDDPFLPAVVMPEEAVLQAAKRSTPALGGPTLIRAECPQCSRAPFHVFSVLCTLIKMLVRPLCAGTPRRCTLSRRRRRSDPTALLLYKVASGRPCVASASALPMPPASEVRALRREHSTWISSQDLSKSSVGEHHRLAVPEARLLPTPSSSPVPARIRCGLATARRLVRPGRH